jgi:hypothetical protein
MMLMSALAGLPGVLPAVNIAGLVAVRNVCLPLSLSDLFLQTEPVPGLDPSKYVSLSQRTYTRTQD